MSKYDKLLLLIEETRNHMTELLLDKGNLIDPEVLKVSQELDQVLNEYHNFIKTVDK
ncbi:aspartyl-phosphate phosphatase Spo0E family protein [Clostridium sp. 19966]|uniref:aspartyl-phosphate phosphatase Spo0E family protein n=1 Tax=Clostridium sp. 19966 TaxID=2768166 RepID=UPI0028DE03BF|nr:aspartyl-phosphate phosphatase Spo0E family protein [Clostridium sp. 19966]MDT8719394.1 aspartyl-phosphate phosphatase Spo0E family protein [Clostridium sp. 19966]